MFSNAGVIFDIKLEEELYAHNLQLVYRSADEANEAVKQFNGQLLDNEVLQVDIYGQRYGSYSYGSYGYGSYGYGSTDVHMMELFLMKVDME